jgi:TonB family protein
MKRLNAFCCMVALSCACSGVAQDSRPAPADGETQTKGEVHADQQSLEILSDTQGVDFKPYLQGVVRQIYDQWLKLMPEEARAPQNKKGETQIRFAINSDGTIAAMHLDGSTQDELLNRAAWGAITGVGKFPALPKEFHGPDLDLRIHFVVNR